MESKDSNMEVIDLSDGKKNVDVRPTKEKLNCLISYPKHVYSLLACEFSERFAYFGIRCILPLYIFSKIQMSQTATTVQYHAFGVYVNSMSIVGCIVADVWLGKYRTILCLLVVNVVGGIILTVGAIPELDDQQTALLYIGLILLGLGSGGFKPVISAFCGNQFKVPEQEALVTRFFSLFIFTMNFGALLAAAVIPNLRAKFDCFNEDQCYPLAFGLPTILFTTSIACLMIGKSSYNPSSIAETPSENMLVVMSKCIWHATVLKFRNRKDLIQRDHFLDYSVERFGQDTVNDIKDLLKIVILYLPLPAFWTLFEQQGSRGTFQAHSMNADLGFYTIPYEQMMLMNPLLVLVLIPIFDLWIYPLLAKIGVRRPLQKLTIGGFLAAFAFALQAILQWQIESRPLHTISIFWQVPQYLVMTAGEIMFAITGLSFSYCEAPDRMKSVVQALWVLTIASGNLLIMIIEGSELFTSRTADFSFYAAFMAIAMFVFMLIAYKYEPRRVERPIKSKLGPLRTTSLSL